MPTATATRTATATATATTVPPTPTATPTQVPQFAEPLATGFNLVTFAGSNQGAQSAFLHLGAALEAAYRWDATTNTWQRYFPGAPEYANTLAVVTKGDALFLDVTGPLTWTY